MSAILPVNVDRLLRNRGVESERVEFKSSWDPATTGPQVLRTICAFANDYHNLNGGYVVIGVAERDGRAILPPRGLPDADVEAAQKWIRSHCNRIDPFYVPTLSPETVEDRRILVAWAPPSDAEVHRAPDRHNRLRYWIRLGSETVDAERRGGLLTSLLRQKTGVPWDDRPARDASVEDLSETKIREHLHDTRSGLLHISDTRKVYQRLRIVKKINDHEAPRNVGMLFFAKDDSLSFRGARIEVVQFATDRPGNVQEDRVFTGGLADQIRNCMNYLGSLSTSHLQKQENGSPVRGWVSYPMPAVRELLVNAVHHRGYDDGHPDPTKVYLYPSRIVIASYPGPVPGVETGHFLPNAEFPLVRTRNRRIGEFLKELGLAEERFSGLPKAFRAMESNGSPPPRFEFDEQRTYFQATLPAHPEYEALSVARDAAHMRVLGQREDALRRIDSAWVSNPGSAVLASEKIRAHGEDGELALAEDVLRVFSEHGPESAVPYVENVLVEALLAGGDPDKAREMLRRSRPALSPRDAVASAIMARRARDSQLAHRYFERAGSAVEADPRALLEFAQTKLWLAGEAFRRRNRESNRRLLTEARGQLERVIQLDASPARHAWAWRELARTLRWLRAPVRDVENAYRKAIALLPRENRFVEELARFREARR